MDGAPPERGDGSPAGDRPTFAVLVTVFQRSRFYSEALRSVAEQAGDVPGVEVVVVRSPNVDILLPDRFKGRGWTVRIVTSESVGQGGFLADAVAATAAEFVLPLDDDDLWDLGRLAALGDVLRRHPQVDYYHNGQSFVGERGEPLPEAAARQRLRRFGGAPRAGVRIATPARLRRSPGGLARTGGLFNNSSVAIRRSVLVDCSAELRRTPDLIDSFMFYAGASTGASLAFDARPWTRYRIHSWNRSRAPPTVRSSERLGPPGSRAGRLAALASIQELVGRRGARWLLPWVERDRAFYDVLEGLREGETQRAATVRRAGRLLRYVGYSDPVMNVVLGLTAAAQATWPAAAHRAYWSNDSAAPGF